jgi:hypothetical protein
MIDLNHGSGAGPSAASNRDASLPMNALIDWACIEESRLDYQQRGSGKGAVAYKRIGAGYIGTKCERELAYRFHKYPKDASTEGDYPEGQLKRHASAGFWTEAKTVDWLRLAGFNITTHQTNPDGTPLMENGKPKQWGFMSAPLPNGQFQLAGEVDGVIVGKPERLPPGMPAEVEKWLGVMEVPCIWESKKGTHKKYQKFVKDGVKGGDERYWAQINTTMAYMGIKAYLFSMLDLDTMQYYWEYGSVDIAFAQEVSDRAVRVIASKSPDEFQRVARDPSSWLCRFCDYRSHCRAEEAPTQVAAPGWMKMGAQA